MKYIRLFIVITHLLKHYFPLRATEVKSFCLSNNNVQTYARTLKFIPRQHKVLRGQLMQSLNIYCFGFVALQQV